MDPRTFSAEDLQAMLKRAQMESEIKKADGKNAIVDGRSRKGMTRQAEVLTGAYTQQEKAATAAEALSPDATDPDSRYFREYLRSLINTEETEPIAEPSELEREIRQLRHRLDKAQRALKQANIHDFISPYAEVYDKLVNSGVTAGHAAVLVRRAEKILREQEPVSERKVFHIIRTQISGLFQDYNSFVKLPADAQRIILLAGATGVGKTATLMKLASQPNIKARGDMALISLDAYGMAATRELEVFSEITGIPFYKARTAEDLNALLPKLKRFQTILVDTAGRSPSFPGYLQEMQEITAVLNPTDILLTLSLANDLEDQFMSAGMFMTLNPTGLIFTKLDETCRAGKMITLAAELSLPIAYIADGQRIPDDLHIPNGVYVWDKLIHNLEG